MEKLFKKLLSGSGVMLFVLICASGAFAQTVYEIDKTHSTIGFAVRHLMVSTVEGSFGDYTGTIQYDKDNPAGFSAEATMQVASIDTRVSGRDNHLKSADFFDAEKFPTITFKSKQLVQEGEQWTIIGDLTIKGVTKEIRLPVTIAGPVKNPMDGIDVIGLSAETTINRQDFSVTWNKTMDQGGVVVDENVKLKIEIEGHAKQ